MDDAKGLRGWSSTRGQSGASGGAFRPSIIQAAGVSGSKVHRGMMRRPTAWGQKLTRAASMPPDGTDLYTASKERGE